MNLPSRWATPSTTALSNTIAAYERCRRETMRALDESIGALKDLLINELLALRPAYPTPGHLEGIKRIGALHHNAIPYGDHLGRPLQGDSPLPAETDYCSRDGMLFLHPLAPPHPKTFEPMWRFHAHEKEALLTAVEETGMQILDHWESYTSLTVRVAPSDPKENRP